MGKLHGALKLIFSNPVSSVSSSLYLEILKFCIEAKAKKHGHLIHNHIIKNGFGSNLHLNNKLIIFYAKLGKVETAYNLFDKMPERNVVSWTAMISCYSQSGFFENSLMMFLEMRRAGVKANQFTYGSVLRACTGMRCLDIGMQIQGCVQKGRFFENLFVQSALIDLHSKCGKMDDACYLFETMRVKDLVCWNAMIGGYAAQELADNAFWMFGSMMREGMIPDCFTLGSVLRAPTGYSGLMKVSQIHGFIIQLGFGSHSFLSGSLINAYARCGSIGSAYLLYKGMPKKDVISCTALITGYAREGNYSRVVFDIFKEITQLRMGIDDVILCSILNICANFASLDLGRQIHTLALKYRANYDMAVGNALIDMYAKCGEIEDANCAFDKMGKKNVISWTTLISGYGKHGCGHKAIALYKQMENEDLKPNDVTFLSLLFACSHAGLTGEGWDCFEHMVSRYNILPRAEHFSCMVDLFARGGQLEEAFNLICEMNLKPHASLWGSILGACSIYGNMSLGEVAAKQLFSMDPENSANYVVLAGIYATAGAWDNAVKTRNLLEERSLKKVPGYSLLHSTKKNIALLQPT